MRKLHYFVLVLFSCILMSCGQTDTTTSDKSENSSISDNVIDIEQDTLPYSQDELYAQLFDSENKIDINLDMADSELARLQTDYEKNQKSPIYRKADMTITITSEDATTSYLIRDVGVRMKGNTSRTDFYNQADGIYNAIHLKVDFQETFDDKTAYGNDAISWENEEERKARTDRTFATLEKLEMRWNKCYDSTYLRESYAYELYRAHDVLAPLTNLCSFDWSGTHMGVYSINEPIDKNFLEKRLPEDALGGDLYKLGWTFTGATFTSTSSIGIENEANNEFYIYDLKTNKKDSQHESLINLITKLNSGNVTKDSFAELVDVDYFLNHAAVSYFLGNPDDLRNNYNNCYLYFRQDTGKAIIIPYDYDRCLGVTYEWNPTGDGMTSDNPFTNLRDGAEHQPAQQENPLFIYSVDKGGFFVEEFAEVLEQVAADPLLSPETFSNKFTRAKALYENDTQPSKLLYNGNERDWSFSLETPGGFNLSFEDYISAKMSTYNYHMNKVDEYVNYVPAEPSTHYIRGNFNNWSSQDGWGMTKEEGLMTFTLSFNEDFRFKVYAENTGEWYGVECLLLDTTVEYTTDEHGNINLGAGVYYVTFAPETNIITIIEM